MYEVDSKVCLQPCGRQIDKGLNTLYFSSNLSGEEDCSDEMTEKNIPNESDNVSTTHPTPRLDNIRVDSVLKIIGSEDENF